MTRTRIAVTALASVTLALGAPLQAQRSRSRGHGIPCGRSYISANKVCHIATPARDSTKDSTHVRRTVTADDITNIRRQRDSLMALLDSIRRMLH